MIDTNTLHGGKIGFDKKLWDITYSSKNKIIYNLISKHLDQGFPGNLNVNCEYKNKKKYFFLYLHILFRSTHTCEFN